jgi:hydrogenase expression/formation protein HypC
MRRFVRASPPVVSFITDHSNQSRFTGVVEGAVCLAIPGRVLEIEELGPLRSARVQFGGIVRQVSLNFVPEALVGDFVMVHVGFAISRVDALEAERTFRILQEMGELEAEAPATDM